MQIKIHTRNANISDETRAYIENKLMAVSEKSMPVIDANLTIDKVKHEFVVEVNLTGKHINHHGTETNENLIAAMDAAVSKIQRQLRKAKEKVKAHSATHLGYIEALPEDKTDKVLDDELIEPEMVEIKNLSLEDAAKSMLETGNEFLLFVDPASDTLHIQCKNNGDSICLIPVTDAVLNDESAEAEITHYNLAGDNGAVRLEKTGAEKIGVPHMTIDKAVTHYHNDASRPFFFYVNSYSGRPNILYYKENHKVSLIVPNINLYKKAAVS